MQSRDKRFAQVILMAGFGLLGCLAGGACIAAGPADASLMSPLGAETDQLIIKYRAEVPAQRQPGNRNHERKAKAVQLEREVAAKAGLPVRYKRAMAARTGAHVVQLPQRLPLGQVRQYARQLAQQLDEVEYVEPDYRRFARRTTPNDPQFNQQWHLLAPEDYPGAANVVNAWDVTRGSADIVIAVLDSGVTAHADLLPALVGGGVSQAGYDMVARADLANDGDGRDANPANPGAPLTGSIDSLWHGVHVAGIVAARPDNGRFVAGVAWNSRLSVVRILSEEGGYLSDQVDGMLWAAGRWFLMHPPICIRRRLST
ncbi:MAG: S8 family serine peptidase [Thiolinea sp.]